MTKIQAAMFVRIPYEIEDGKIIFDTELNGAVTFADGQQIGYLDYGHEELAHVDVRLLILKKFLLPEEKKERVVVADGVHKRHCYQGQESGCKYGESNCPRKGKCTFEEYSGPCNQEGFPFCEKHLKHKCFECGEQAVRYCYWEGSNFGICGQDECADHSHEHK